MSWSRLFWAGLAVMVVMAGAASSAFAFQVTVTVHGAGKVTESTPRNLMDCTVSPDGRSNSSLTNCIAGTPAGGYAFGDIVNLNASVPTDAASRGWAFVKWVDSSLSGKINCDPQGTTGDHFSTSCQFQIFDNLSIDLHFVDSSGPQDTVITSSGPNSPTNQTSATFNFNAPSDPDSTFECKLDRPGQPGSFLPCGTPVDKTESYGGLTTNGAYAFSVRGKDPSGNVDLTPDSQFWTIDTVPPFLTLSGGPPEGSVTNSTSATFGIATNEGTLICRRDATVIACNQPQVLSGLADGPHTFMIQATDLAGNFSSLSRAWTVDTVAPQTSIDSGPTGVTSDSTPTFTFSSEGGATFQCRVDVAAFAACTSPHTTAALADGTHTFDVRATDAAGNTDVTFASRTFTVDTTAPQTSIDSGPTEATSDSTPSFAFSSEVGATFQCRVDAAAFVACTSPHTTAALADGAHTFEVRATDAVGNTDATPASRTWTVDTLAPPAAVIFSGPSGIRSSTSESFSFVSPESGVSYVCALDAGAPASCTSPQAYSSLAQGAHTFHVSAVDPAGNVSSETTRSWTVDTVKPNTFLTAKPKAQTTARTATFRFVATESGSTFQCKLDKGAWKACKSPKTFRGLKKGKHTFQVRAKDGAGNLDGSAAKRTWRVR